MISIQTRTHVGVDGTLSVQVPTTLREMDVDVMLIVQPIPDSSPSLEEMDWPPGFFEETFGCLADDPIERLPPPERNACRTI